MKLKIWDYAKVVQKLLDQHGIKCNIELFDKQTPLAYSITYNELRMNIMAINSFLNKKDYPNLSDEEVLTIMTYHEIGHIFDFREHPCLLERAIEIKQFGTSEEWKEFNIERELNAWKYAKELVPPHLLIEFDDLNEKSVKIYEEM